MNKINPHLSGAKRNKNDEFYTQLDDIDRELALHMGHFKNKTVYCNCDDPRASKFFHYFSHQFEHLQLKKLIATCYKNIQPNMFSSHDSEQAIWLEYDGDKNGNKIPDPEEIGIHKLKGDGDFRSKECVEILKKVDIVCTNPPFSLFREYVAQLMEHKKKFLIIGNINAITYAEIFPYIMANKLWVSSRINHFIVPDTNPKADKSGKMDRKGNKLVSVSAIWFTNIPTKNRSEELQLVYEYNEEDYPKYDNYDAIEVNETKRIPKNYDGIMGVPLTFLDKYNPNQFEILGCTQRGCHDKVPDTRKYDSYKEMNPDGTPTGSSGNKTNENANLLGNDGKKKYFTNGTREIQSCYGRIFIRHKGI